ncbi:hypothetical protein BDZ91DRAFT_724594 [Kalaharituber pfeilii]|nr:hypothetical protein BDZ91DRAFT_724594 [Kalaharituber pfeilii]
MFSIIGAKANLNGFIAATAILLRLLLAKYLFVLIVNTNILAYSSTSVSMTLSAPTVVSFA